MGYILKILFVYTVCKQVKGYVFLLMKQSDHDNHRMRSLEPNQWLLVDVIEGYR